MHQPSFRVLTINPAATSTKIGVFDNEYSIFEKIIYHAQDEMAPYPRIVDQHQFRKQAILEQLDNEGINLSKLSAVCARGGLIRAIEGGTYEVNARMLQDLKLEYNGEHASNLGGILAHEIANGLNIPAFIADPVVVDELWELARFSGVPAVPRKSIFHALSQKRVAYKAAKDMNLAYENANLIVAHMGSGITIGAHLKGKVVDVNNGLDGDGPFSPERAGTIPAGDLVSLCYSGDYSRDDMMKMLVGKGGLMAYLGTKDPVEVERRMANGDFAALKTYEAMAYQIVKEIGSMSAVLAGDVDAIVLTGKLSYSQSFIDMIARNVDWIADMLIYPGENELEALNEGALRVLRKEESPKIYPNNADGMIKERTIYGEGL